MLDYDALDYGLGVASFYYTSFASFKLLVLFLMSTFNNVSSGGSVAAVYRLLLAVVVVVVVVAAAAANFSFLDHLFQRDGTRHFFQLRRGVLTGVVAKQTFSVAGVVARIVDDNGSFALVHPTS